MGEPHDSGRGQIGDLEHGWKLAKGDNMIKRFLRGMLMGISITSLGSFVVFLFVKGIELLSYFCKLHHLNSTLVGGIIYILLGGTILGVLEVTKKV